MNKIHKSVNTIQKLSSDDSIKEMIRLREEADLLENTRLYNAEKRGRAEGIAQGRAEGIAQGFESLIAGMKAAGLTEEQITAAINAAKKL